MRSLEERAEKIDTTLSPRHLYYVVAEKMKHIQDHLHTASIIKHSPTLSKLIKRIIASSPNASHHPKIFFIIPSKEGEGTQGFIKERKGTERCLSDLSFRLTHLEHLLLEKTINLRTYRQQKASLIRHQLACLKDPMKEGREFVMKVKVLKKTLKNHGDANAQEQTGKYSLYDNHLNSMSNFHS